MRPKEATLTSGPHVSRLPSGRQSGKGTPQATPIAGTCGFGAWTKLGTTGPGSARPPLPHAHVTQATRLRAPHRPLGTTRGGHCHQ
eukprot:3035602-Pyramimonas_sp.AAC.1